MCQLCHLCSQVDKLNIFKHHFLVWTVLICFPLNVSNYTWNFSTKLTASMKRTGESQWWCRHPHITKPRKRSQLVISFINNTRIKCFKVSFKSEIYFHITSWITSFPKSSMIIIIYVVYVDHFSRPNVLKTDTCWKSVRMFTTAEQHTKALTNTLAQTATCYVSECGSVDWCEDVCLHADASLCQIFLLPLMTNNQRAFSANK